VQIKFWGVRGSIPSGSKETVGIGGNTSCVEVRCGNELIILDTGTGARNLGVSLMNKMPLKATILFSHVHWDHIQGFPFFGPFFIPGNEFRVFGGTSLPITIKEVLNQQMMPPNFPVKTDLFGSKISYHDVKPGEVIEGDHYKVTLAPLFHPNGCYAYRIEHEGKTFVFCTDCEHYEDRSNSNLIELCKDADALVYDAQYTDDEYYGLNGQFSRKGWGHSTMREGIKVAKAANVKKLVLFHHDPTHDDNFIKQIEAECRQLFPQSIAAYEGLQIDLSQDALPNSFFD
jgi:phosphoribosyl 1,2-cyclic phosphodiesterase